MSEFLRDVSARIGLEIDAGGLDHFNHRLEGMHRSLEVIAGAEILKGLFEIAERFSGMGEQIETAAASAGITTEVFQELSFAAAQAGVGQEKLGMSLNQLSRQLEAAREGSDGAIETFAKIGISPEQLASFSNSEDALKGVADRVAAIEDPIKRTQTAMKLFGRGGAQMVRFLAQGSAGISEEMENAGKMGAVVSANQIEQLAKLEDALSAFGAVMKAAFATVAVYVAPIIKMVVKDLEDFWQANRALINTNLKKWFGDLAYYIGFIVGFVQGLVKDFNSFIATFPRLSAGIATVIKDLILFSAGWTIGGRVLGLFKDAFSAMSAVVTAGKLAFDLTSLTAGGFFKVLSWGKGFVSDLALALSGLISTTLPGLSAVLGRLGLALAATPVGVLAAGIAALIVAGHDLWKLWQGGDFWKDTWLGQGITAIMSAAKVVGKWLGLTNDKATVTEITDPAEITKMRLAAMNQPLTADAQASLTDLAGSMRPVRGSVPDLVAPSLANGNMAVASAGAVTMQNTFNITVPPGAEAQQIAGLIKDEFDKAHSKMLQQTQDSLMKPRVM
ncbi:MAG: hypothetical protein EOO38_00070 [Cytophagaceae bacterium]|nr:MAG: hypothetical protein EOO38_00070 [Cytophagaceae bacterium]